MADQYKAPQADWRFSHGKPDATSVAELVDLYTKPTQRHATMKFEPGVAQAVKTGNSFQYTQDIPGDDIRRELPFEKVLGETFGADGTSKEGVELARLARNTDRWRTEGYFPFTGDETDTPVPYLKLLSPSTQAEIVSLSSKPWADLTPKDVSRSNRLREKVKAELELTYPGITRQLVHLTDKDWASPVLPYVPSTWDIRYSDSGTTSKDYLIGAIKDHVAQHIKGFESGHPQFYTQRPGYVGASQIKEARKALAYMREVYPEDAMSYLIMKRYVDQAEKDYPQMRGATEFPGTLEQQRSRPLSLDELTGIELGALDTDRQFVLDEYDTRIKALQDMIDVERRRPVTSRSGGNTLQILEQRLAELQYEKQRQLSSVDMKQQTVDELLKFYGAR